MNKLQEFLHWLDEQYTIIPSDEYGDFLPSTIDANSLYVKFVTEKNSNIFSKDIQDFMDQKIVIHFDNVDEYQICRKKMEDMGYIIGNPRNFPTDSRGYDYDFPYCYVQTIMHPSNKRILNNSYKVENAESFGMVIKEAKDLDFMIQIQKDMEDKNESIKNNNSITLSEYFDSCHINFMTHPKIEIHYYIRLDNGCNKEIIKQLDLFTALDKYGGWELSDGIVEKVETKDDRDYFKAWLIEPKEKDLELEYIKDDESDKPDKLNDDKPSLYAEWYLKIMEPEGKTPETTFPEYGDEGLMY